MADQSLPIQGINWRETFPFIHLFRAFRVAIHPSKIVLGLVALLLLYLGGHILDSLCPVQNRAIPGEAAAYESFERHAHPGEKFSDYRTVAHRQLQAAYGQQLLRHKVVSTSADADKAAADGDKLGALKDALLSERQHDVDVAEKAHSDAIANAEKLSGTARTEALEAAEQDYTAAMRFAYDTASTEYEQARAVRGDGLFVHFFEYESNQLSNVVRGVREWNWLGEEQIGAGEDVRAAPDNPLDPQQPSAALLRSTVLSESFGQPGVVQSLFRFLTVGPVWMLTQHTVYFIILGIYFLLLWAIFGGAIARIAGVHVARDEKLSIRSALKFSVNKFLSFLFAPIIPMLIIVVVGLAIAIGSLLGNIPFLGPIIIGLLFFLALAGGFVMALVLLGLVGGFNLMYPTIAVEGSDSFDAISRSFSYLYARPWRLAFYSVVTVVYGALTYLFVRLFISLMLALTHKFVGMGMFVHAASTSPLWPTMWPNPATAARLSYDVDYLALGAGQSFGAMLISFWVFLVIAILGGFAISFYFSANTIIYFLMRREVDATEMDDVYLEQVDDEFTETAAPVPTPPATTDTTPDNTPASPAPPDVSAPPQ